MGATSPTLLTPSGVSGRWKEDETPACTAEPPRMSDPVAIGVSMSS